MKVGKGTEGGDIAIGETGIFVADWDCLGRNVQEVL